MTERSKPRSYIDDLLRLAGMPETDASAIKQEALSIIMRLGRDADRMAEIRRKYSERSRARIQSAGALTPSLRYEVLKRDGFRCVMCGHSATQGAELAVDHIVPIAAGGLTERENLQTACRTCNAGKGDRV